jgi:predicted dehydrogenase
LDDPRVDIVSIATPHHWHALASIWAMQAGKDIYVEKPVGHTLCEGQRMVETARRHRRVCQVGLQTRSNPGIRSAIAFLRAGGIGVVDHARITVQGPANHSARNAAEVARHVDYNLWQGPAAAAPLTRSRFHHDWHWQWPYGHGLFGQLGMLPLDMARWGLGATDSCQFVRSWGGHSEHAGDMQTPDTQVAWFDFGGKTLLMEARVRPSAPRYGGRSSVTFFGSTGTLEIVGLGHVTARDADGHELGRFEGTGGSEPHFANFLRAVRKGACGELHADVEEGHLSSCLVHLAQISYRLGHRNTPDDSWTRMPEGPGRQELELALKRIDRTLAARSFQQAAGQVQVGAELKWDTSAERIVNHRAANQLLARTCRAPFIVPAAGCV